MCSRSLRLDSTRRARVKSQGGPGGEPAPRCALPFHPVPFSACGCLCLRGCFGSSDSTSWSIPLLYQAISICGPDLHFPPVYYRSQFLPNSPSPKWARGCFSLYPTANYAVICFICLKPPLPAIWSSVASSLRPSSQFQSFILI